MRSGPATKCRATLEDAPSVGTDVPGGPARSFATRVPGHIVPVQLGQGVDFMVHRHGFLCATPEVTLTVGFQQSLGAGIFGGDGFILQRVGGQGTAWLELSGELIQKDLAPGEVLRVHPGHVGAFHASVAFQITTVPGIKNMIFGGDGIFLAQLTGPGSSGSRLCPSRAWRIKSASTCPIAAARSPPNRPAPASSAASWVPSLAEASDKARRDWIGHRLA